MRPGARRPEGPRAARLCEDSRPGLERGLPERPQSRPGRALRAPLLPQSGLKSIFHSTGPKSPRAPKPFRPPWERWGGDGEGWGETAAPCSRSRPEQTRAERLGGAPETPEEGIVTEFAARACVFCWPLQIFLAHCASPLPSQAVCLFLPFLPLYRPLPHHHFPSVSSPFPFASPSVPGKEKLP